MFIFIITDRDVLFGCLVNDMVDNIIRETDHIAAAAEIFTDGDIFGLSEKLLIITVEHIFRNCTVETIDGLLHVTDRKQAFVAFIVLDAL